MIRLTWALPDGPHVLSDPEPVVIPTHQPDAKGKFGIVAYSACNVLRQATYEDIEQWRSS